MTTATTLCEDFRQAIAQSGLTPPDEIVADGRFHRFASNGNPYDDAGWYKLFADGMPAGAFGCHRSLPTQKWCAKSDQQMTPAERAEYRTRIEAIQRQRDGEVRRRQTAVAKQARTLWEQNPPAAADHPYLLAKQVQPHGLRVQDAFNLLIIPVMINHTITSLQFITVTGEKKFLSGGAVKGGSFVFGDLTGTPIILIAEGFATGASLHEATGYPTVIAFHAHNLVLVAQQLRQHYPTTTIVLCGDHDPHDDGKPNTGLLEATNAAHAINGRLAMADLGGQQCDWNDVARARGPEAVRAAIEQVVHPQPAAHTEADFTLISADTVTMAAVQWVLPGRIPLGMVTVLAGKSGIAKSTMAIDWAAQLTRGRAAGALAGQPAAVIICSAEDTEAYTLVPRLTAAQADLTKVHFIRLHRGGLDGSLTIPDDLDILTRAVHQTGAKFVIIDPLMAHLSARLNSWSDHEIRQAFTPLARLAETLSVTILIIAHLNKDATKDALDRIGGSIATGNAARSVLFAGKDPNDPDGLGRMLAHPKCNVGAEQPTLRYHTEVVLLPHDPEPIETTKIVWDGEAPGMTAEDLVAKSEPISREDKAQAVTWLETALPVGTRRKQPDLEAAATHAGISRWALWKAKSALQVKSQKEGFRPAVWWWQRETAPYQTSSLKSSVENIANPLTNANISEESTPQIFDNSSAPEDLRNPSPQIFDESSNISTPYLSLPIEDLSSQIIYGEDDSLEPQTQPPDLFGEEENDVNLDA